MFRLLGRQKGTTTTQPDAYATSAPTGQGWRFSLKGSPRHYDDVKRIIEAEGEARVWFGEALAYERGAAVALWRIQADSFGWLPKLYAWWAEQERIEPILFTFHLYLPIEPIQVGSHRYLPNSPKYPALDLREHSAADVEAYIKEHAPKGPAAAR